MGNKNKFNNTKTIAIDSNILTYYVDATTYGFNPDLLHENEEEYRVNKERVASFQIPMYSKWYAILPTVRAEYQKIKNDKDKLSLHIYADQIFTEYEDDPFDNPGIKKRATEFNSIHSGEKKYNDCLITAEAEFLADTTILLSNDNDLINRIGPIVNNLLILRPSEFVERFNLKAEKLKISPLESNFLSHVNWWKL